MRHPLPPSFSSDLAVFHEGGKRERRKRKGGAHQPLHLLLVARSGEMRIPDGVSHKVASWRVIAGILKCEEISAGKISRNKENSVGEHLHAVQERRTRAGASNENSCISVSERAMSRKLWTFPQNCRRGIISSGGESKLPKGY